VGWFENTLPDFLANRLKPGSIIVFDEYFSYIGWENHEHAAFEEFIREHQRNFDYILSNSRISIASSCSFDMNF
tara:strand:+ start:667 stop:888 length:222 start_codon:yes stop_codon:yes gene_type:complete